MLSDVASDLRMALRSLRLRPGFSALVVFTLALGIGATTAVFALANQVLLRPLPGVRDPGGAAYLEFRRADDPSRRTGIAALDFVDLRAAATSLEGMGAYTRNSQNVSLAEGGTIGISTNLIQGDYFELLGVRALRGRLLGADETALAAPPDVAVISEAFWSYLGRSEDVVGSAIQVDGKAVTILGVAGGGFVGAERNGRVDVWLPMSARGVTAEDLASRRSISHGSNSGGVLLRPRRGVTIAAAEAEVIRIFERLARESELSGAHLATIQPRVFASINTIPMSREATYGTLRILAYIVLMVLLIACANAANLLLFRGARRRGDVAVRRAMGASGGRVARQELVESLMLTFLGSAGGLAIAWGLALIFRGEQLTFGAGPFQGLELDGRVLAFAVAAALVTTLLAGVLPAALAGRVQLTDTLREAGRQATSGRASLRAAISAVQIALCIPLLVGALMLTRTLQKLYSMDLGLSPEGVVAFGVSGGGRQPREVQAQMLEAVRGVPGVEAAAIADAGPFTGGVRGGARLPSASADETVGVRNVYLSPGWFEVLGVETQSGRGLEEDDWRVGAPARVVITAPLARRLFGHTDVTGRTLISRFNTDVEAEIVGVVGDVRLSGPEAPADEALLLPYHLVPVSQLILLVRTESFDAQLVQDVQRAVASALPDVPPPLPELLTARIDRQLAEQRVFGRLLGLVSAITVTLAALGLYGVVAFAVVARKRELGIRITLGSSGSRIAGLVLRQVAVILGVGVVLGLGGARALSRLLESRVFGLTTSDPISYAGGALLLVLVAALACLMPVRSAVRVDPAVTLREE